jgi:hypothetical protein
MPRVCSRESSLAASEWMMIQERLRANNQGALFRVGYLGSSAISRWLTPAIIAVLGVWMAIAWIHLVGTVIRFYSPLPFWDYWETVPRFEQFLHHDLVGALWRQHNEHRIVFPSLIFIADYAFFAGREVLPLALHVIFYFSTWLLLSAAIYDAPIPLPARVIGCLIAGIVMAWEGAALAMAGAMLVVWSLLLVSATAALFFLGSVRSAGRSWVHFVLALACAVVTNYAAANGVFFWPILLCAGWILGLTRIRMMILAVTALFCSGMYFVGYQFSTENNIGNLWRHPLYALEFIGAYLGVPFTVVRPWLGVSIGLGLLVGFVVMVITAAKRGVLNSRAGVVLAGIYVLCVVTASLTTLGRMNPSDPGFGAASAQRYIIFPLVADASLLIMSAWLFAPRYFYRWAIVSLVFATGVYSSERSPAVHDWCEFPKVVLRNTQFVSLALKSGVTDPALLTSVYPDVRAARDRLEVLRERQFSIFSGRGANWLGKSASSLVQVVSTKPLAGAVTHIVPVDGGLVVTGWTDYPRRIESPQQLVFLNERQKVIGYGEKLPAGIPREFAFLDTPQSLAWIGFVSVDIPSRTTTAFAIENKGKALIQVGKSFSVPLIRGASADRAGSVITPLDWSIEGSWVKDGPLPVKPPNMPAGIEYFESWSGNDRNVGSIHSGMFATPAGHCIVLSGASGPSTENVSEALSDADTHEVIASVPFDSRDTEWRYWSIAIPESVRNLRIDAEDRGNGWGEWLAIGEPRSCK